ncbi:PREDICTED: kallikrein-14-like, partial [Cariama cristata]|uniref:kallikrein-14-like n=1 Tax=Cariama cristata TaxID=54380 RepID=UPI0005204731
MARDGHGAFSFIPIFILAAGLLLTTPSPARAQVKGNEGDERTTIVLVGTTIILVEIIIILLGTTITLVGITIILVGITITLAGTTITLVGTLRLPLAVPEEDESRIIGGKPCSIGQRPFQVALLKRGQILCGGSLIDAQWVLTAAHCKKPINDLKVLIGTDTLRGGTGEVRSISKLRVHPAYNPYKNDNDFMLLRLDKPVRFGANVKKIRLATRCPTDGMKCSVSGWGTIKSPG